MLSEITHIIQEQAAVALYFKGARCSVCEVLQPKIQELLSDHFPKFSFHSFLQNKETASLAAHYGVFNAPTLLLFLEGKEILRTGKNTSIPQLRSQLERSYEICFGEK